MKYTNMTNKFANFLIGAVYVIFILFIVGAAGAFLWVDISQEIPGLSLLWIVLLPTFGLGINWSVGHFCGDEYYNTGLVREGRSVLDVVKTPKYYKRRMYLCFIECGLFVLLMVRYCIHFAVTVAVPIIGVLASIAAIIIYFVVGMSSYELSGLKEQHAAKMAEQAQPEEKQIESVEEKPAKPVYAFDFDKFPALLPKYEAFKLWNSRKNKSRKAGEGLEMIATEYKNALEDLASSVFEIFAEIKPDIVVKNTGEKLKWEVAFGKPYAELKYLQKLALARLLDRHYKYTLPSKYYKD